MGGAKKQTVSYWYKLIAHFGFAKGPVDAMLEWRGGDRVIWKGRQETSGIISVNKPDLYGGESAEGGVVGDFELMMGEHDQAPNSYLASIFGALQSAYRGRLTGVLRGAKIGAGNPYPKAMAWKFVRILKGWDDDVCWYPEKAGVPIASAESTISTFIEDYSQGLAPYTAVAGGPSLDGFTVDTAMGGPAMRIDGAYLGSSRTIRRYTPSGAWLGFSVEATLDEAAADDNAVLYFFGPSGETEVAIGILNINRQAIYAPGGVQRATFWAFGSYEDSATGVALTDVTLDPLLVYRFEGDYLAEEGRWELRTYEDGSLINTVSMPVAGPPGSVNNIRFQSEIAAGLAHFGPVSYSYVPVAFDQLGMNPAHILYDSITSRKENGGMGEPTGRINEASFEAAADKAYSEGFGLCTTWKGGESAEQFQQRICNVVGWNCSQDILDGQYYIDMLRGDYVLEDLPVITDDDIIEFRAEPNSLTEAINHLSVAWYNQETMEARVTTPVQSLGAIEGAGGVIPEVREYYEIPSESLALRVADRDLRAGATPLWRFQILANRRALSLRRPGRYFRLMAPNRGFADMVCVVSEIGFGSFENGAIQVNAIQDGFSLADTVFVDPQNSLDEQPNGAALPPPASIAIESPYVELASALATADKDALTEDSGYLQVGAARPTGSLNYALATAIAGSDFEVAGANADWTPTALLAETPLEGVPATVIAYNSASLLDNVVIGTWALWGSEIVRVDAVDQDGELLTLGRGCGDTVPQEHSANERVWFIGDWYGSDNKEYAAGEDVQAKALTRTGQDQLALGAAPTLEVTMDSRQARPYPPGKLRITDDNETNVAYPATTRVGELEVSWAHRDRLLQADLLVPEGDADVGPEAGTTYNVRYYLNDVLDEEEIGILGTSAAPYTLSGNGSVRVEVESERDGLVSWQIATAEFPYLASPNNTRIVVGGNRRITVGGNARATKG
jgi:hypothetical protein